MAKRIQTSIGALLAVAGVGVAVGAGLGYALAGRSHSTAPPAAIPRSAEDARRAIAELVAEPPTLESEERLARLLQQLGPEAVPAVAPTILHPGETLDAARALLLIQFWIDHDPKGAAEWAAMRSPLGYRLLALDPAVEQIARTDPRYALRYVGAGPSTNPQMIKPLVRGWFHSGEPGLEDWLRNLGYSGKRQKALGSFLREKIARDGAAAAISWYEGLPDSDDGFKDDAFLRITGELTYADPAQGIAWYEKHREGPNAKGLMMSVVDAWVAVDGPEAMHWLSQQPPGRERDEAVLDGVRWWGVADIEGLKRWGRETGVDNLEAWFQPGLPIFARLLAADDPLAGIQWGERIADESTRSLTLVQIAREWRVSDRAAADAWLATSPLSEEERARAARVSVPRGPKPADQQAP